MSNEIVWREPIVAEPRSKFLSYRRTSFSVTPSHGLARTVYLRKSFPD
jgi:hypothetical protein